MDDSLRVGADSLTQLGNHWAARLTTYRRDGTPVSTPVNVAVDRGRVFFRTYEQAGKFKRLRNNPEVDVAPSDARGRPTGPSTRAVARLLNGDDDRLAATLVDRKHRVFQGILIRLAHRLRGYTTRHFELLPPSNAAAGQSD